MQTLVLIGGGHSHAIVLRLLGLNPLPQIRLVLITDTAYAPYSGMLPGHLSGIYSFQECHIDLQALAQFAQAELILDEATGLDLHHNQVFCRHHEPVAFDWLSINIGSTPKTSAVPGAEEFAIAAKPVSQFLAAWQQFLAEIPHSPSPLSLGIVGGGAGGIELALNLQIYLNNLTPDQAPVQIHLFHRQANLMTGSRTKISQKFQQVLSDRGVQLHLAELVIALEKHPNGLKQVRCQSGLTTLCHRVLWVTQAFAPPWIAQSGLATDAQGFILIDETLRSISHPQIFATGDIATMAQHPRPKAGVFAVRQGSPLVKNLRRSLQELPLQPFVPQQRYLALIGLGDRTAMATWGNLCLGPSKWLWNGKDWIDRQFMAQFINPQRPNIG